MKIANSIADLFSDRIWTIDTSSSTKAYAGFIRFVKLVRITVNTFAENRMGFQCVALSYFVTLAIIPLLAFIFAVTGGLGLSTRISEFLYKVFPGDPHIVDSVMEKASGLFDSVKGGGLGIISALTFIWTILWMMFQVERVFNNVWGIRKIPRKIYKRFGYYLLVLALSPFLVVIFGTGIAYYTNITNLIGLDLSDLSIIFEILGYVVFYIITALTFSAMYKFIPATKVRYRCALQAALLSAFVFVLFQYCYLETQMFVGRLNGAYGVIAAIPLFLIWLNFSWQIIMYGAELSYGIQNVDKYNVSEWDNENKL